MAYGAVAVVFLYSFGYLQVRRLLKGEFFVLGLFALLGIMVLISANSLVTLYLGVELLALSLYAMVAFNRESGVAGRGRHQVFRAGLDRLRRAAVRHVDDLRRDRARCSSGRSARRWPRSGPNQIGLLFGLAFIIVGIAFKFGAVPFHMWVPDVYHGAPTAVTLFLSSAPKLASFALAFRLLAEGLGGLHDGWQDMLVVVALLSMAIGNVVAIAQTNLKRMLAYSTISHVGFILMGILAGTSEGYQAALYYTITYVIMAIGGFGMIILLSRAGFEADRLDDFKGLNARSPWFAAVMLMLMFSMAGVPPFVGFWAKLAVIQAALNVGLLWLAIAAVIFSVIGAYYYLRVVKLMYFDEPREPRARSRAAASFRFVLSANGLAVLLLGLYPGLLLALCAPGAAVAGGV